MTAMLVFDFVRTDWSFDDIRHRLTADPLDWLAAHARAAGAETSAGADPTPRLPLAHHLIDVRVGEPRTIGDELVIPVHWEAEHARALFPVMDGDLHVAPFPAGGTWFSFNGAYTPPFGPLGAGLDRLALHRVAEANARDLLARIVDSVRSAPELRATGTA